MNIEQLDLIIQIAANPQNEEAGNALAQFNKFKQEPNAHFISVELFSASTNPNTKFVCLQVIESFLMARNVGGLLEDDIILLKKFIETHILDLKNHDKAPEYVSIKFAVVTVLFLRHTFLSCWNNFWDWIIGTLEFGSLNADMFVKILKEFDQEIVEYHSKQNVHKHNTSIKDAMRKYQPSGRTVSHEITDSLFQIISSYVESDEQLCADTLLVTAPLIVWFDLCLFVNEKFITLFIGLLQSSTCCVAASKCLLQIVKKGMPIDSKLKLISELQLLNLLDSLPFDSVALDPKSKFAGTDEYDIQEDFYIEIALVLNHIGLFILDGVRVIIKPTEEVLSEETKGMILAMVGNSYRLLRRYFISTNCAISEECLPYFETLVSCIGMEKKYNPAIKIISSQIEDVIVLLSERLKLPDWFTGSHIDEDEGHFSCFRSQVRMIFVNLTRHNTETVLSFILEIVNAGLHQMQNLAMADAELILFHVFHFGESVPRFCKTNETFSTLIKTIIGSDAWNHPHPLVIQLLMQICTRYAGILESEEQLLMKVFGHITGESGLRHADRFTRGRSCYDIMRLVQKTKTRSTSPVLRNALLNQIEPFLHIESNPEGNSICFKDKQHLFETSSVLLASVEDTETKIHLFQRISNPLLSKLEENLVNVNQIDAELVNQKCFEILSQIGHFTKGFGSPVPEMMPVFTRFFEASMQVVQALPEAKEARSKVYFLLQRLTTCTGPAIIEFAEIALPILIREACSSDMKENIRFINVLCRLKDIDVTELLAQRIYLFFQTYWGVYLKQ
eukprot:TRINITY_DN316_c0_g1_i3.p1 TRINITY_DN316_c0_g1~~TRINITY_DN316_c0_g1_i3.p1  ORF type:complete len:789 (-),score=116.59 TRINITY_DN316_c0_g1_i3:639-3005(-)